VDWVVLVVLLVLAAGWPRRAPGWSPGDGGRADADEEAGTDRAVLSLVLLAIALGVGAAGAAVAASGSAGPVQVAVFLAALAAVVLPVAGVLLGARRGRDRPRRALRR
jgi:drug/metabolite transporter (DMT)-like permease